MNICKSLQRGVSINYVVLRVATGICVLHKNRNNIVQHPNNAAPALTLSVLSTLYISFQNNNSTHPF